MSVSDRDYLEMANKRLELQRRVLKLEAENKKLKHMLNSLGQMLNGLGLTEPEDATEKGKPEWKE